MRIDSILNNIELPAVYEREGKKCYYDPYRKKLIEITPEETVRQRVAAMFEKVYKVPRDMIFLEVPMSYYAKGFSGRADIIIHALEEESKSSYPILVIECKNEKVFLTDLVAEQAGRYCDIIDGKYIAITNGLEMEFAVYNEKTNSYVFLDKVLSYVQMVGEEVLIPKLEEEKIIRYSIEELKNQELLSNYNESGMWIFGEDTYPKFRSLAVNFYQALLDTEHCLPKIKRKNFELIDDLGRRYSDYGNAGGGHYNGIYRAFLVRDGFNEVQIISMSIFGTDANFRAEHRNSYTSLVVAVDRFKTSHSSLQYNVDKFVKITGEKAHFLHNGQISGYKSDCVKEMILLNGDGVTLSSCGIKLGIIDINKVLYLDDNDVTELVYNFIEYVLLREEVRKKRS